MINHNLDFDIDESNLKVIYILDIGKDSDNKNIYHFLLSENCEDTFSEGWDEKPSCNIDPSILKPDEGQYEYIKQLNGCSIGLGTILLLYLAPRL